MDYSNKFDGFKKNSPNQLTEIDFSKLARDYALAHIDEPQYKHMVTEQKNDFNIYNYLYIKIVKFSDEYQITINLRNDIHPEYIKLNFFTIYYDNQQIKRKRKDKISGEISSTFQYSKIKLIEMQVKNEYILKIKNNNQNSIKLIAEIGAKNDCGLLDIELVENINL